MGRFAGSQSWQGRGEGALTQPCSYTKPRGQHTKDVAQTPGEGKRRRRMANLSTKHGATSKSPLPAGDAAGPPSPRWLPAPQRPQPRDHTMPAVRETSGSRGTIPLARKRLIGRGPGPEPQRARKGPLRLPQEISPKLMRARQVTHHPNKGGDAPVPLHGSTDKNCVLLL